LYSQRPNASVGGTDVASQSKRYGAEAYVDRISFRDCVSKAHTWKREVSFCAPDCAFGSHRIDVDVSVFVCH
jgi:hypothetical protein